MADEDRILVVEDEVHIARAVMAILKKGLNGYKVDHAKNGQAALDMANAFQYQMIISDWNMPKKNGDELLIELRAGEAYADVPFIMLTARGDRDSTQIAIDAGADDYIVKPFKTPEFIAKVKALLAVEDAAGVENKCGASVSEIIGPAKEIVDQFRNGDVTLPVFPEVALKVNDLFYSEEVSVSDIARVVESDVSITSHLISVANSSLLRGAKPCASIEQAITRLGVEQARQDILLVASKGFFKSDNKKLKEYLEDLWGHSLATAYCARYLAESIGHDRANEMFVLGLLHDVGKLLLVMIIEDLSKKKSCFDDSAIKSIMDQLHAEFGSILLKSWHFSEEFQSAAHYHHSPFNAEKVTPELLIVYLSNLMVRKIGFGKEEDDIDNVSDSTAAKKLRIGPEMIQGVLEKARVSMEESRRL